MLARVQSFVLQGIDALPCEVEVDHDEADEHRHTVVGLPDAAVKESVERVRSALGNSGYVFPRGRTLINLAPADVRKEGPLYDLPIAIGLLTNGGVIGDRPGVRRIGVGRLGSSPAGPFSPADGPTSPPLDLREFLVAGELALDGRVRPVRGAIAMASLASAQGRRGVIVPAENAAEAAVVPGVEVLGVRTLAEVVGLATGHLDPAPHPPADIERLLSTASPPVDFSEVRGQEAVKRALVIAAAGAHNILMLGPAGTGKTMMARALPGILPPLSPAEAVEITRIASAAGVGTANGRQRGIHGEH
ncbi:ATP-binding protein [Leptolyngbya sp. 15MV]|nr:ATP-binding protein [Leptolyngbya sp. 15MV]